MKFKAIATVTLLAFVILCVVFIVLKEKRRETPTDRGRQAGSGEVAQPPASSPGGSAGTSARASAAEDTTATPAVENGIIAYYFYTTRRCPTCRKLEAYTREAITSGFADDLRDRSLVLRVLNVDLPGNEHYVQDYSLTTKSVVLVAMNVGKETRWKNLSRIWDLVGDKPAFINYIQDEVRTFQEGR
jgi:hypothetical protein